MDAFKNDKREECKYGGGCYQKNPGHLKRFKHPPKVEAIGASTETNKGIRNFFSPKRNETKNGEKNKRAQDEKEKAVEEPPAKKTKHDLSSDEEESHDKEEAPTITSKVNHDVSGDEDEDNKENSQSNNTDASESKETKIEEVFDDILPPSPKDNREDIKQKFLVDMPEDFYQFFEFCQSLSPSSPCSALSSSCGLLLVGPFDILGGKIPDSAVRSSRLFLRHWRFYYDPPEFQTVLTASGKNEKQFHIGYFRDDPKQAPAFVAANSAAEGPKISPLGDNIFGAVANHIGNMLRTADPFSRTRLLALQDSVKKKGAELGLSVDMKTAGMRQRERKKMAATFHGAGMVVPYDKKTQVGYREIPETTASLKRIFRNVVEAEGDEERDKAFDVLQELVTNVQFANDEGDPGMGLELGLDMFCHGGVILHNTVQHLLTVAYDLLGRDEFGTIITAHLGNRRKTSDLNMFK